MQFTGVIYINNKRLRPWKTFSKLSLFPITLELSHFYRFYVTERLYIPSGAQIKDLQSFSNCLCFLKLCFFNWRVFSPADLLFALPNFYKRKHMFQLPCHLHKLSWEAVSSLNSDSSYQGCSTLFTFRSELWDFVLHQSWLQSFSVW